MLSGAVFNVFVCAADIPDFLNFFVPEIISHTEVQTLVILILVDVIKVAIVLIICNHDFIRFQNIIDFQSKSPVVPDFFDVGVQAHERFQSSQLDLLVVHVPIVDAQKPSFFLSNLTVLLVCINKLLDLILLT